MESIVWLIIAALVIIVDIVASTFIIMWFSVGALVALVLSLMGVPVIYQIIAFLSVSVCVICVGYPWVRKKFKVQVDHVGTMEKSYIGNIYVAVSDIEMEGQVKIGGIYWTVVNEGECIRKGEKFKVKDIQSTKLIVEKVNN